MARSLKNMMGAGLGAATASLINGIVADGLISTGTTQADALPLPADVNVTAVVVAGSGVLLPAVPQPGDEILIANMGANALLVYPSPGSTVQGGTPNMPFSLPAGATATFIARQGSANWIVLASSGTITPPPPPPPPPPPTFTAALSLGENMIDPDNWAGVQSFIDLAVGGGSNIESLPSTNMVPFANRDANGNPISLPAGDTSFRFFLQAPYVSVPYVLQWTGSPVGSPNLHNGLGAPPSVDYSQLASNKIIFTPAANNSYFLDYTNGATAPSNWTCRPQTDPGGTIEAHLTTNMAQITMPTSFTRFVKWTSLEKRNNSPIQPSGAGAAISSITFVGTTATVTTSTAHGLSGQGNGTGQQASITVTGATPAAYNVTNVLITVISPTQFTYTMLSTPAGNASVVGSFTYGDTNFQFWNLKYPNPATEPGTQFNEPIYTSVKRNLNAADCEYLDGVKVETIITVASALSNNPWFDVPWNADDTFYTAVANQWATFALNHPTKKVAIAHSNEDWNPGYTVAHQCWNEANFRGTQADASVLPSVRLIATTNLALSGLSAIDGFTPIAGDRIICTGQTTATQNGVYVAAAGAWSRAADTIASLSKWFVTTGLTNAQTTWFVQNAGAITLGTTALVIPQFTNLCRYVEKTIAVMQIFETAFAAQGVSAQLVRTFGWQNASSPNNWDTVAAYPNALAHCDAFAVGPYYGNTSTGADVPTVAASIASDIGLVTDQAKGHYAKALQYSKNLTMYEGGVNGFISNSTLMAAYVASTQCYDNELAWLQQLELKCPTIAGTIFTSINHFAYSYPIGNDSNQWGTLSAGDQSASVAQKGKAHIDFIAGKRVLADSTGTLSHAVTNMAVGTSLGALSPSAHGIVWSLTANDSGDFAINATTGVVTTAANLSGVTVGNRSITDRQTNPADGTFHDTVRTIVLDAAPAASSWDATNSSSDYTLSNANLTATRSSGSGLRIIVNNQAKSTGKWYFEGVTTTNPGAGATFGIIQVGNYSAAVDWVGGNPNSVGWTDTDGHVYVNGSWDGHPESTLATWAVNDVIGVAVDLGAGKIYFRKNGVWQNSADPVAGTGGKPIPVGITNAVPGATGTGSTYVFVGSFASGFANAAPTGYSAWA